MEKFMWKKGFLLRFSVLLSWYFVLGKTVWQISTRFLLKCVGYSISSWKPDTEHQPSGEMQNKNKSSVWIMKSEIHRFNRFILAEVIDTSHWKLIQDLFCLVSYCEWYIFLPKNTGLGFSLIISWVGQRDLIWFWIYKVRGLCHLMCEKLLDCGIIQFL